MAKVYYWLKLNKDFFKGKEIKKLRKIAGGDTYTIIYLKLQLLSLKDEGKLYFDGIEETFAEELALELDEDSDNISFVLMYLKKCGLIQEISDSELLLNEVPMSIGKETDKAQLMRNKRLKDKKTIENSNNVTKELPPVTFCYTEIEKEIEKDKDININKKTKKGKITSIDSLLNSYTSNEELRNTLVDFIKMRKSIKKPMTDRALQIMLKKLQGLSEIEEIQIKILENSIENCWQGIFPLKEDRNGGIKQNTRSSEKKFNVKIPEWKPSYTESTGDEPI